MPPEDNVTLVQPEYTKLTVYVVPGPKIKYNVLLSQFTPGHIELYSASVNVTTCVFFHTFVYVSIFFILPSSAVSTVDVIDVSAVFGIELNFAVFTTPVVN